MLPSPATATGSTFHTLKSSLTHYLSFIVLCALLLTLLLLLLFYTHPSYLYPFLLTLFSSFSTLIGAILCFTLFHSVKPPIHPKYLAYTTGLATGAMLYISIIQMLLPYLLVDNDNLQSSTSLLSYMISLCNTHNCSVLLIYCMGMIIITWIIRYLPDDPMQLTGTVITQHHPYPHHHHHGGDNELFHHKHTMNQYHDHHVNHESHHNDRESERESESDDTNHMIGSIKKIPIQSVERDHMNDDDHINQDEERNPSRAINEYTPKEKNCSSSATIDPARTLRFGIITSIVLALHNLPEGLAVFVSTLNQQSYHHEESSDNINHINEIEKSSNYHSSDDHTNVLLICIGIAIHNIAEGLMIAIPIYTSTLSYTLTLYYTTLTAITEPIGALFSLFLFSSYLTTHPHTITYLLIFVGGIMCAVSLIELMPEGLRYKQHYALLSGMITGVGVISILSWIT